MAFSLQLNDSGKRIYHLQACLVSEGLLRSADGSFGIQTESAIKEFQNSKGLDVDGVVGRNTLSVLLQPKLTTPFSLPLTQFQIEFICDNEISPENLILLNGAMELFDISTPVRIRHFIAQIAHESGGLRYWCEIADGSDYEGREDLGNTEEGDGCRFRGIDPIQTTGRYNYSRLSRYLNDPRVMKGFEYVRDNIPCFLPSGFWWHDNKINDYIDDGATCREVSYRVNGTDPAYGLEEREKYYALAELVINE